MNQECEYRWCNNKVYKNHNKCILHCEKDKSLFEDANFEKTFTDALIRDIVKQRKKTILKLNHLTTQGFINFLKEEKIDEKSASFRHYSPLVSDKMIVLEHIVFPSKVEHSKNFMIPESEENSPLYINILKKLNRAMFHVCEFHITEIENEEKVCSFQNCTFHTHWKLKNYKTSDKLSMENALYTECSFIYGVSSSRQELTYSQFSDCKINHIQCYETVFKKPIFNNSKNFTEEIKMITLMDSRVEDKFILNNHQIKHISLKDSIFKKKFEFKHNKDVECTIANTNFEGLVDCYKTNFQRFIAQKSIFNDFVGFEKCNFGNFTDEKPTLFQHATFLSFINFREAHFHNGLDMRDANLKEYPNFLGAKIVFKNTNKETYRIIKHSFDKVGNTTEANKYYAYEMDKELKDTNGIDYPSKKITLLLSQAISHHGQSLIMPLIWIIILGVIHHYVYLWLDNTTIYNLFPNYNVDHDFIKSLSNNINNFARNILPFKRFLTEGKEFISLLFLIGYSTLIYHFIVAVKRTTKR